MIYFIVPDYSDAEDIKNAYATIKEWVDLLHGIIISSDNLLKQKKSLRWRGSIDISGSQVILKFSTFCGVRNEFMKLLLVLLGQKKHRS